VRLKEKGATTGVIAVARSPTPCKVTMRIALAVGVDRAVLVARADELQPPPGLVMLGKWAIGDYCNQTAQMLAAFAKLPQAAVVSTLEVMDGVAHASHLRSTAGADPAQLADRDHPGLFNHRSVPSRWPRSRSAEVRGPDRARPGR